MIKIDPNLNETANIEPQLTSNDPNERKLARSLRIQRRNEAVQRKTVMTEHQFDITGQIEIDPIQQQLQQSSKLIEKLRIEGEEYITNVRIANDSREVDRREYAELHKNELMEKLEEEANAALDMFSEIANKWSNILKYNDPLYINDEMLSQKEKCDELIKQKDNIIAMLRDELKKADLDFAKDQRKQIDDINSLSKRIEKQINIMRQAFKEELELLEEVILNERQLLIDSNNKHWNELYEKRDENEINNSNEKFKQVEKFDNDMKELRINFYERYRQQKIQLENNIEHLQFELEQIKYVSLINNEKMDYNYQILKKREDENIIIKSQQKRRMNKLQDLINNLRRKIRDLNNNTLNDYKKLTTDILKLRKQFIDIENKSERFANINNMKYEQIWNLNEKRSKELIGKIFDIDRVLFEQQLGIDWLKPQVNNIFNKNQLKSYQNALKLCALSDNKEIIKYEPADNTSIETKSDISREDNELNLYRGLFKRIMSQISDKSGFLIEEKLNEILKPYSIENRTLVRIDNIFSALGIKNKEDIDLMMKYFLPYTHCPICSSKANITMIEKNDLNNLSEDISHISSISYESNVADNNNILINNDLLSKNQSVDSNCTIEDILLNVIDNPDNIKKLSDNDNNLLFGECKGPTVKKLNLKDEDSEQLSKHLWEENEIECHKIHTLYISSVFIIKALREFIEVYRTPKPRLPTMTMRISKKLNTISRLISKSDVELFWEQFNKMFPIERSELWDNIYKGLKKYHEILKERKNVSEEVIQLRRQNFELQRLLENYIKESNKK